MGLDNYWKYREDGEEIVKLDIQPPLKLRGGMFSGNGGGFFRGKVYAKIVEEVTGESIYDDWIPNNRIVEMARKMEETPWESDFEELYGCKRSEYKDLVCMFVEYAKAGCGLVAWY